MRGDRSSRSIGAAVLLAAGRGSRLSPLTDELHKSLLPFASTTSLDLALDALWRGGVEDVVLVTGDKRAQVEEHVRRGHGDRVRFVHNPDHAVDMNILSADLGVSALRRPEAGYLIVETDIVIERRGWELLLGGDSSRSFWVTRGRYAPSLTGGALRADPAGNVRELVYEPKYQPRCEGFEKLIGILHVGPSEVLEDRRLRAEALIRTRSQYYMTPWVQNLGRLPCRSLPLGECFAGSYNDVASYRELARRYALLPEVSA